MFLANGGRRVEEISRLFADDNAVKKSAKKQAAAAAAGGEAAASTSDNGKKGNGNKKGKGKGRGSKNRGGGGSGSGVVVGLTEAQESALEKEQAEKAKEATQAVSERVLLLQYECESSSGKEID